MFLRVLLAVGLLVGSALGRDVTQLHGANFELTLTSYKYIAILFYDGTNAGRNMKNNWMMAAEIIDDLSPDSDIAQVTLTLLR